MSLNRPLVALVCEAADPARRVAFGPGTDSARSRADLLSDARALAVELVADRRWLVKTEDAYRIAVALLAAAMAGARIVLPPNLQPGTLEQLATECERVLVDGSSRLAGDARALDPLAPGAARADESTARGAARISPGSIDREAPLVELFTSGSSGPGKSVTKSLCHLEDEVVVLEETLGRDLDRAACVLATVSAHHLYGLLFRVLWPLATGRPLSRVSFLLPDELLARVAEAGSAIVVSSPAHLRHLAASARLAEQAGVLRAVFSSGGPLEPATALALEAAVGHAPVEIFGSTETGGVASRRVTASDPSPRWSMFPGVTIEVSADEQQLVVTSPFVTAPSGSAGPASHSWCMGDRVERDGDGFRLLGRSDRIAKVGEKTFSLPEIETSLATHEDVESALVGTYNDRSGPRLGAIVVLSASGRRRLAEVGRRALHQALAEHLAQRWNRVALPRRWRFRDALPADARGKTTQDAFEAELARVDAEPREALLLSQHRDGDTAVSELVVPRDLAYFAGHYDAFPLVPGAVQLQWVLLATGRLLGRDVGAQRMEAIKFKNVLRPAQVFTMRLRVDSEGRSPARVVFTLADGSRIFSSGRITLAS